MDLFLSKRGRRTVYDTEIKFEFFEKYFYHAENKKMPLNQLILRICYVLRGLPSIFFL